MNVPPDYNRETHANLMIELVTMAFACDLTRVVSFMLDDARSDYVYTPRAHAQVQHPGAPACCRRRARARAPTITACSTRATTTTASRPSRYWNAQKAAMMAQALASIKEGGGTALDNTVIHFGSGMHGGNHDGLNIPIVLIGSGGGVLKQNAYLQMTGDAPGGGVRLANLHLTLIAEGLRQPDEVLRRRRREQGTPARHPRVALGQLNRPRRASRRGARAWPRDRRRSPAWTAEVWIVVLRGATSQWKRSRRGHRGDGAGRPGSPSQTARQALEVPHDLAGVDSGASARSARGSCDLDSGSRGKRRSAQKRMTPALTNSSRSTRGTTRTTA